MCGINVPARPFLFPHRLLHAVSRQGGQALRFTAIEMYKSMDMTFWLPQTEAALAQVEGR